MNNRRLIEDSLPLGEISKYSAAEKSIRQGNISTLHLWWARRPLAAARAATLAALLPAPKNSDERQRLHDLIAGSLGWDLAKDPRALHSKLRGILGLTDTSPRPKVLDPFAGGGALPLEAERVGAAAYATDLNPVAHLIQLATLTFPERYASLLSTRTAEEQLTRPTRLAVDFDRWRRVILERVTDQVGALYKLDSGREAALFIWCRTAVCDNPTCRAQLPLVGSFSLLRTDDAHVYLRPIVDKKKKAVDFEIVRDGVDAEAPEGLVKRSNAECLVCGQVTASKSLKSQGSQSGLGHRLLAIAYKARGGKDFAVPSVQERKRAESIVVPGGRIGDLSAVPDESLPINDTRAFFPVLYGLTQWGRLYNPRQLTTMIALVEAVRAAREEIQADSKDVDATGDYAKALCTLLSLGVSKLADYCSTICTINQARGGSAKNTFRMNALQMTWDYAETNPLQEGAGGWLTATKSILDNLELLAFPGEAHVARASADSLPFQDHFFDAIVTDPPYYDAVPYSDLSDYFYVWLRRLLFDFYPEELATPLTPKRSEMVQNTAQGKSAEFFESAMSRAFGEMHRTLKDDGIMVLVFAHKSTSAWETLLKALLDNNLVVTASWPIETEKPGRTRAIGSAALASSVFIVCRKRSAHDDGFLDDVEPDLKSRLHERLDYFWSQGIRGADFFMSAIGPAVEVFGRHKRVLKLSGEEVTIAELLDKVRGIVADYALQRIVRGEAAGNVDEASRFYVIWRWAYGTSEVESGEAIHMAQSMGCEFSELVADSGVLTKSGDKVTLKGPVDRKKTKGLGEPGATGVLAPLIDVLHRAANLWAAGERQDLADFLATALPPGGVDHMQRLAQSIVDVLPPGDKERALYENFLVGARSLPQPTKKDEAAVKQQKLF